MVSVEVAAQPEDSPCPTCRFCQPALSGNQMSLSPTESRTRRSAKLLEWFQSEMRRSAEEEVKKYSSWYQPIQAELLLYQKEWRAAKNETRQNFNWCYFLKFAQLPLTLWYNNLCVNVIRTAIVGNLSFWNPNLCLFSFQSHTVIKIWTILHGFQI